MAQTKQFRDLLPQATAALANNSETKSLQTTSHKSLAALDCIKRFRDANNLLTVFNPSNQFKYCLDADRCFTGKAPTLYAAASAFNLQVAEAWIAIQLRDLSEFAGCKEKLSTAQIEEIAKTVYVSFGYLKLTELMLFFFRFKSGFYGKFYGVVDGLVITSSLQDFLKQRRQELIRIEREEEKKEREIADAKHSEITLSRQEWIELKWLFNMGYEPERIKKELAWQRNQPCKNR